MHHTKKRLLSVLFVAICAVWAGPAASAESDYYKGEAREAAMAEIARIAQIQSRHEADILKTPGVFAIGIGHDAASGALVFRIVVDEQAPMPPLPAEIEGVPVVVERDTPPAAINGGSACIPCHAAQFSLPVDMGNSGRTGITCGMCTMGFKACEEQTGDAVWVTAAHCAADASTCPGSAPIGTTTYHRSNGDASCTLQSPVGNVSVHAPPVAGGTTDATSVESDGTLTNTTIRDIGAPSATPGTAAPGDAVQKSGRTTGYTTGEVDAVNVAVNITYNCGTIRLTQQIRIDDTTGDIFCTGGDSGSGLLNFEQPPQVVGLVVAANAAGTRCWANDANNVLAALGLSMNHTACFDDTCPGLSVAAKSSRPAEASDLLYQLRDNVLEETPLGRSWVDRFYANAAGWVALYAQRPDLFDAARGALDAHLDVLEAVAERRAITISRKRLRSVRGLLRQHAQAADGELAAAFEAWRMELGQRAVQRSFGVTVR